MRPEHWLYTIPLRLRSLFRGAQADQELDEELRDHLERKTEEYVAKGMAPEKARRRARLDLSGLEQTKEKCRDTRRVNWIQDLIQDIRYGLRTLRKSPGFTSVAVLTLALGIGANTAIFSLINAVILKMLPVTDPEQLLLVRWESPHVVTDSLPYPTFCQLRDTNSVFSGMFAFLSPRLATSINGRAGMAAGQLVSGSYFSMLGVQAIAGRTFTSEEDRIPGSDPVAVISYEYWKRTFGLGPSVVGKAITLNGVPFTIIGVAARGFEGVSLGDRRDIWIPMMMQTQVMDGRSLLNDPKGWFFQIMARRKPGISDAQAAASLNVLYQRIVRRESGAQISPKVDQELARQKIVLVPASKGLSDLRERLSEPLLILMALVSLVLLVACANVASLILARASARQKEMSMRAALGASRWRLLRQLLTESLLLGGLGGVLGLLFAIWGDDLLLSLPWNNGAPLPLALHLDTTMLLFTASVSLLTAIVFGSASAWRASRADLTAALKEKAGDFAAGPQSRQVRWGLRRLVAMGEVAMSLVLLVGAGMLVRSLLRLRDVDPGFNQNNVLLVSVDPTLLGFRGDSLMNFYERLADAVRTLPGVRSVGLSAIPPLSRSQWLTGVFVQGHVPEANEKTTSRWNTVSPDYFQTLDMPVLRGRDFTLQDNATAPKVAIINEALAHYYFGDESAVGKRLSFTSPDRGEIEIIGVVKDAKYSSLRETTPHMLYLPYFQTPAGSAPYGMTLEIRTVGRPTSMADAVREAIRGVEKDVPFAGFIALAEEVDTSFAQERTVAQLSSFFGLLALLLASVGLYGVMMYSVTRKTREIGIRMAFGAERAQVLWMVLRESLQLVVVGAALGVPAALAFGRLIASQLYGIRAIDPTTILVSVVLLACVAAIASYIPARRAIRVDPIVALRYE